MQKQVYLCDVCGKRMNSQYDTMSSCMIEPGYFGQWWITKSGKTYDVCDSCCGLLADAKRLGIIELDIDIDAILLNQGWEETEDGYGRGRVTRHRPVKFGTGT